MVLVVYPTEFELHINDFAYKLFDMAYVGNVNTIQVYYLGLFQTSLKINLFIYKYILKSPMGQVLFYANCILTHSFWSKAENFPSQA